MVTARVCPGGWHSGCLTVWLREGGSMCLHTESSGVHPRLLPACRVPVVRGVTLGSGLTEKVALSICVKRTHTCTHTDTHAHTHSEQRIRKCKQFVGERETYGLLFFGLKSRGSGNEFTEFPPSAG